MIEYIFFNFILIKLIIKNIFIMLLSEVFFFIKKNGKKLNQFLKTFNLYKIMNKYI